MKKFTKTDPPNPMDAKYRTNPLMWQRDMWEWGKNMAGKLEQASAINDSPLDQAFQVTGFTTATSLTGTSTGTDVSNFLCSFIQALTNKGIVKSK